MSARTKVFAAGVALSAVAGAPSTALAAEDYVGKTPPQEEDRVLGTTFSREPQVESVRTSRAPEAGGLPITGGDVAGMTLIGFGAVALGSVLLRRGRTRAVTA
jgi:hypothetical protein